MSIWKIGGRWTIAEGGKRVEVLTPPSRIFFVGRYISKGRISVHSGVFRKVMLPVTAAQNQSRCQNNSDWRWQH